MNYRYLLVVLVVLAGISGAVIEYVQNRKPEEEFSFGRNENACEVCGRTVHIDDDGLQANGDRFSDYKKFDIHYDCISERTKENIAKAN